MKRPDPPYQPEYATATGWFIILGGLVGVTGFVIGAILVVVLR